MTGPAVAWDALTAELDRWAEAGRRIDFWWRDDDAVTVTPALERLLVLQGQTAVPLALAVVPAQADQGLADCLSKHPDIVALQHGYAHENHAGVTGKKSEFPAGRPLPLRCADLKAGKDRLQSLFGARLLPVLVPPWNRAADDLLPILPGLGFAAISGFKPYADRQAAPGLIRLNTQVDPIDWHGGNPPAGAARALEAACTMLRGMRLGELPLQPVGLLTHHLRHDQAAWDFTAAFLATARHAAVRWINAAAALAVSGPAAVTRTS